MTVGIPKEIKKKEYRVGCTPAGAKAYAAAGHTVVVEQNAGVEAGFDDKEYENAGAQILGSAREIFERAEMICKVKEPQPEEYDLFRDGQILYTFLHLAADRTLTEELVKRGVKGVAYETMETDTGALPLLRPMSEIAGRMSIQEGAKFLERPTGGRGVLLGGVPGTEKGKVAILGGGVVGTNAAKMAVGLGAQVTVLDVNMDRLEYLDDIFSGRITTLYSSKAHLEHVVEESDLIVGAVLIHGAKAPHLITRKQLKDMKRGSVIVDVAVDQGGCIETTKPTTHDEPIYVVDDVVHYCVANMPGAVSRTSTLALNTATLPYGLKIAEHGLEAACQMDPVIARGVNTYGGKLTYEAVAEAFGMSYTSVDTVIPNARL